MELVSYWTFFLGLNILLSIYAHENTTVKFGTRCACIQSAFAEGLAAAGSGVK
jgi:hypothetical protein